MNTKRRADSGRRRFLLPVLVGLVLVGLHPPVAASVDGPVTRAELLRQKRLSKMNQRQPAEQGRLEKAMVYIQEEHLLQKIFSMEPVFNFRPKFGLGDDGDRQQVLESGSGLAFGLLWEKKDLAPGVHLTWGGSLSTRLYRLADVRLELQDMLARPGFYSQFHALYWNYPQLDFYGIGTSSREEDQVNYRSENFEFRYGIGQTWANVFTTELAAGYLRTRIGPGTAREHPSIEEVFDEDSAPGMFREPAYYYIRPHIRWDSRDNPGYPCAGTVLDFQATFYQDHTLHRYSFDTYEFEAQQFFPFLQKHRVIALRAKAQLTDVDRNAGQRVPFYMLPYLGGGNSLRGYREFRFFDENYLLFNAEYRWKAWTGLEMALFADYGDVFRRIEDVGLSELRCSYGFGFRFMTGRSVFLRADIAWHEWGRPRVFIKMHKIF
ncbi:MAG: BamA/TamA family outer membrane protein [Acidobacteria bacterium]|nr:BamA/TamA family outer membrane protein [Acidobacteriota bacterium]